MSARIIAIDWSGAIKEEHKKIWLAEVANGHLIRLESGRDRTTTIAHIIEEAIKAPDLIVGLDFAFSAPAWFVQSKGCQTAHEFWGLARTQGEAWMREWPFWMSRKPDPHPEGEYRRCEKSCAENLPIRPSSVFKLVGASQVGRGSIRGMPSLLQLHESGFSIWPFDPPAWPRVVEIYPRLFSPRITKSDQDARVRFLEKFSNRCKQKTLRKRRSPTTRLTP